MKNYPPHIPTVAEIRLNRNQPKRSYMELITDRLRINDAVQFKYVHLTLSGYIRGIYRASGTSFYDIEEAGGRRRLFKQVEEDRITGKL